MTRRIPTEMTPRMALVTAMVALASACGGEEITVGGPPPAPTTAPAPTPTTPATPDPAAAPEEAATPVPTLPTYRDEDFVEADANRDPFRNFAFLFVPRGPTERPTQRRVLMDATSVDEMHLIAIISGVANPSAMLLDGSGTGHTVHRGDYVGRAEYVSTGGADSVPITLNWRVDRISPTEVVLSREDPGSPDQVGLTRVLPLHDPATQGT
jgi:hypothetical protein